MIQFSAPRPGAWLREDIADILSALALCNDDARYLTALRDMGLALGLASHEEPNTAVHVESCLRIR